MIDNRHAAIGLLAIHHIGCKSRGEELAYSASALNLLDDGLRDTLVRFFTAHFREPEYFRFTWAGDEVVLNPLYNFVSNVFDDPTCLHEQSVHIARRLYDAGDHPNIKEGDLLVAYITGLLREGEAVDAIGIIKVENRENFLRTTQDGHTFDLAMESGIATTKVDKACLVLNSCRDDGYMVLNIDHSNRNREALYWRDEFLHLTPRNDNYQQTKNYIQVTKEFIKERMPAEFETDKGSEAAIMGRSFEYFKNNEKFDAQEYEVKVFKDNKVVEAFQDFRQDYEGYRSVTLADEFDISEPAVRKQSRVFRSVIKLDKNFHIYVHGDKNRIFKGTDDDGRKYYMLYYDEEA